MATPPIHGSRLESLDALRGIAAFAVVLFHYTHYFTVAFPDQPRAPLDFAVGKHGVSLFFAISGFVIFMTLEKTRAASDFLVSRFARLYPAYWAAIILTTVTVTISGLTKFALPARAVAINFTMLQSFFYVPAVDGVYWTLAVELSFYACMFALWRVGLLARIENVLIGWLALKWLWWLVPGLPWLLGSILVQKYIPFFAMGILAYRVWAGQRTARAQGPALFAILATIAVIDDGETALAAAFVAIIFAFIAVRVPIGPMPRLLTWLGGISYTLYLVHENIGYAILLALEHRGFGPGAAIISALVSALFLAWLVAVSVERPALKAIRGWWRSRATRTAT